MKKVLRPIIEDYEKNYRTKWFHIPPYPFYDFGRFKRSIGGGDLLIIVENMLFSLPNLNVAFNLKTFLFVVVFRKWGPDGNTESPFRLIPLPFKMIHFVVFDSEWFCINLSTCKTHLCMWQSTLHIFARPFKLKFTNRKWPRATVTPISSVKNNP